MRLAALPLVCASLIAISCGQLEFAAVDAAGRAGMSSDAGEAGEPAVAGGASGENSTGGQRSAGASGVNASGGAQSGGAGLAGANDGTAGAAGQDSGATCAEPSAAAWLGCFAGQPCAVCASKIATFPLYLPRHPRCTSFPVCDHNEQQSPCSADCPEPGAADQCDGTPGNWRGCRGLGCYVCTELVAGFPQYFSHHPFCLDNSTCQGVYFTCSPACPAPTEADR